MEEITGVQVISGTSSKVRELYEAVKREQKGIRENPAATVTYESALRDAGVGKTLFAKKVKEQLEALRPEWNPKKQAFDFFPDYRARHAALRLILEIDGSFRAEIGDDEGPVIINLGIPRYNDPDPSDGRERSAR